MFEFSKLNVCANISQAFYRIVTWVKILNDLMVGCAYVNVDYFLMLNHLNFCVTLKFVWRRWSKRLDLFICSIHYSDTYGADFFYQLKINFKLNFIKKIADEINIRYLSSALILWLQKNWWRIFSTLSLYRMQFIFCWDFGGDVIGKTFVTFKPVCILFLNEVKCKECEN